MGKTANPENVSTTRGVKGGYAFCAPVGTPLPADLMSPIDDAFQCAGYISEDGFKEGLDGGGSTLKDMNGDIVDATNEAKTETIALTFIEMGEEALAVQYGHKNVDASNDDYIVVDHNWSSAEEELSWVFELVLKNGRRWRKVVNRAKVTSLGEFTGNSTTVTGREATMTYQTDENGSGCKDYIQKVKAPAAATTPNLDSMTVDQLKAYAAERSIDISGKTAKADILAAIKTAEAGE